MKSPKTTKPTPPAEAKQLSDELGLAIIDQHFLIKIALEQVDGEPEALIAMMRSIDHFNDLIFKLHQKMEGEENA